MPPPDLLPDMFFDLKSFSHQEIFSGCQFVWEAIPKIEHYLRNLFETGKVKANYGKDIYLGEGTIVEPGAYIIGPAVIGRNCRIGHVAYLRENILTGDNCVLGHAGEIKNSLFLNDSIIAHLNYVGDSLIGAGVNVSAGAILANFRLDQKNVRAHVGEHIHETNLQKFGSIIGDGSRVGVNSVLNPGTILGKNCLVYPLMSVKGFHPAESTIR